MESHYEINVSLNGIHLFATAPRSALTRAQAKRLFDTIRSRFPEAEGFKVGVTYWVGAGDNVTEELNRDA